MKKILIGILIGMMLSAGIIFAGTVTDEFDVWWEEKKTLYDNPNSAKASLQNFIRAYDEVKQHKDAGDFNNFPTTWKAKALAAWNNFSPVLEAMKADAEFMEGIEWRP